uniref:Replication factor A C-terminal domain-containing protein n=1 Tax=Brassica oleracea var. oleracea TaxID=109376 RepID=A0A0D3AS55_BRAOL
MASSGVVIAHSAFDGLRLRTYAPFIVGRLIRFWDAKNIKKQGNLYLNSTPATKFYFDPELDAIAEFTTSLEAPLGEAFPCIDTKEGVKKKEVVSIGELNKFISNSDEQTQEADFICKGRVVEVMQQNEWSFVSCTGCSRKLDKFGTSLRCNCCINPNIAGVINVKVSGEGNEPNPPACVRSVAVNAHNCKINETPSVDVKSEETSTSASASKTSTAEQDIESDGSKDSGKKKTTEKIDGSFGSIVKESEEDIIAAHDEKGKEVVLKQSLEKQIGESATGKEVVLKLLADLEAGNISNRTDRVESPNGFQVLSDIKEEGEIEDDREDVVHQEDEIYIMVAKTEESLAVGKPTDSRAASSQTANQKGRDKAGRKQTLPNKSFIQAVKSSSNKKVSSKRK